MSATRRRLLIAVPVALVFSAIGFLAIMTCIGLSRARDQERYFDKMGKHIRGVARALEFRQERDYKAEDDDSCMNSWRVLLVIGSTGWPDNDYFKLPDYNKCWKTFYFEPDLFCPSSDDSTPWKDHHTEIMGIVGPDTPFTELMDGQRVQNIKDFPNDALLLLEVPDSNTHWTQAGDMQISDLETAAKRQETLGTGFSTNGRWVAFADGQIWLLDKDTPISALLPFCTIEGAMKHDRNDLLWDYLIYKYDSL